MTAANLSNSSDHELLAAAQSYAAFRDHKRPFELWNHVGEYHGKWQPAHRRAIYKRNIDWFNFWLLDRIGVAPANDPDQYERWRGLREQVLSN